MERYIRNIVFACADPLALGSFYAELLDMRVIRTDWFVVARDENSFPRLAFGDGPGPYRPPRWPDPEQPQQVHLDFTAYDLDAAGELALRLGASLLQDQGEYRSYADPAGHPFCLYRGGTEGQSSGGPVSPGVDTIVYDCFSPPTLAALYAKLLDMTNRLEDSEGRIMLLRDDASPPALAFQHAPEYIAPRWPDPDYPQQLHIDVHVDDGAEAEALALRLGAIRLPALGGSCPVYADPEGHPFCLCSPGE